MMSMEMKVVCDGLEVPLEAPLPKPIPRPSHVMDSDMSKTQPNTQLECPRRKTEQGSNPCRKRKATFDGGTPHCTSCESYKADSSCTQVIKKRKRQDKKKSLDLMAERIERMECMLREKGFLKDDQGKTQVTEEDLEDIVDEIGKDVISVPSLCGTGFESTIQTGITATGATNMDPPPLPHNAKGLGHVEKWLETLPPLVAGAPSFSAAFEAPPGENG